MFMKPGYKTTEFITHLGVLLGSAATIIGTVFDKGFLASHPIFSSVIAGIAMIAAGASQVAYTFGRSSVKMAQASDMIMMGDQPTTNVVG